MTLYDNLPLDTPTKIAEDANREVWATRTRNGSTIEERAKSGSPAANRATIEQQLTQGLAALQSIIDAPDVTFSNLAQAQTAMRQVQAAVKANARQLRRLTRLALGLLDAAD